MSEAGNPPPSKDELPFVEPIGFANELNPMDKKARKNPAEVVQAALQAAQTKSRAARYADFNAMDTGDIAAMLDAVVDATLTFEDVGEEHCFKVEADEEAVQELLSQAKLQAKMEQLAVEALRDILKYGDCFGEPIFSDQLLTWVQTYQPAEIYVTKDDKGRLATGKDDDGFPIAYQQKKQGTTVAGWNPDELVHGKFWPSRKLLYSEKSLLDPIRATWRKLELVEQGMVVARVTRAYPRRVHYVDVTNKARDDQEKTLKEYIYRMSRKQYGRKPTNDDGIPLVDVSDDLYIATGYETGPDGKPLEKLNRTEIEDPATAGLSELADVIYLRQKMWSQVPSDVVGIKRNTTTDLDSQDIAFTRLIRRCQQQLEEFLRGILDQVLLANGRDPKLTPYRIKMPTVDMRGSWKWSDARFRASMTLRNYLEVGIASRRFALKQAYNLSDQEIDQMWSEIEEEQSLPIFQALLAPALGGVSVAADPAAGGDKPKEPTSTGKKVVPATGAKAYKPSTTGSGISRGTKLGQRNRGSMSGG